MFGQSGDEKLENSRSKRVFALSGVTLVGLLGAVGMKAGSR